MKLNFVQTLSIRFGQDFEVKLQARFAAGVWSVFVLLMFCRGYVESNCQLKRYEIKPAGESLMAFAKCRQHTASFTGIKFTKQELVSQLVS